jgi:transcriptional antiterminator RfaH
MAYWACFQIDQRRERLALFCLGLSGFAVYQPRLKAPRKTSVPLFPSYLFVAIEAQWHAARWSPGVSKVIMAGEQPARVPDAVIDELQSRERNGLIVLPPPPSSAPQFLPGDKVRLTGGPLIGLSGLVEGMKSYERVTVLLELLGSVRPIEMAEADVELARE